MGPSASNEGARPERAAAAENGRHRRAVHVGEEDRGGQDQRQQHQHPDHERRQDIQLQPVRPGSQQLPVVTEQQQKHRCARQQHARQGLALVSRPRGTFGMSTSAAAAAMSVQ